MNTKGVQRGMTVRSTDGEKLGEVVACEADHLVIEKGFFFPKDYLARYEDVADVQGDEVLLRQSGAQLREQSARAGEGYAAGGSTTERTAGMASGSSEHVSVPVVEEELSAEKRMSEAGEVKVQKHATTERREISVPVTKEEVHVERAPASAEAKPGEAAFRDETISVPVREEEVEIKKRPVVREQVRISKTARQEERRASDDVRREEVDVEKDGDVEVKGTDRGEPRE
ncbi:MAG TPA: YsnF/AvaK domain-containing protein [Anaeromyxobacter sp.]|nr:YsnF/AvaK domain-containing protein [Anaeromyxobacter sp.]